jgi:hypothetical protein
MSVHEDRRDVKTQRIPFDAIVEIGGGTDQSAFEAQGVDLSAMGMHLRTAYLPDIGQPLLCRFDGGGQEVSAEASVMWRREGSRGGEFGIQFTNVDGDSASALRQMCGVVTPRPEADVERASRECDPGTRVRLHIDGLGSPMKARVRGATEDELMVGSNLEFLKVGRSIELEDVDRGGKRAAHIDRVDVEIDRVSKVPQLIVTLRYDDAPGESVVTSAPPQRGRTHEAPALRSSEAEMSAPRPPEPAVREAESDGDDDLDAAAQMRSRFSNAAADLMPTMARLGSRAKTTAALLVRKAFERSGGASVPRRTTAPPPTGALHATGKRVIRDAADDGDEPIARPRVGKKTLMMGLGGATGLSVVLVVMALHKPSVPPPGTEETAAATNVIAAPAPVEIAAATAAPEVSVPLFGPTIMSTTEPVTTGPTAGPTSPSGAGAGSALGASSASAEFPSSLDDAPADEEDSRSEARKPKVASFTHGKLTHPILIRLKTDGTITEMHGVRTPTGFTVALPGRRAPEANGLASRDARIASLRVNNGGKGTEVSVQFKDGVPPYAVRARGHDIVIALGRPASDDDDDDKPTATAKKGSEPARHRAKKD